jgi:hypothetical protein
MEINYDKKIQDYELRIRQLEKTISLDATNHLATKVKKEFKKINTLFVDIKNHLFSNGRAISKATHTIEKQDVQIETFMEMTHKIYNIMEMHSDKIEQHEGRITNFENFLEDLNKKKISLTKYKTPQIWFLDDTDIASESTDSQSNELWNSPIERNTKTIQAILKLLEIQESMNTDFRGVIKAIEKALKIHDKLIKTHNKLIKVNSQKIKELEQSNSPALPHFQPKDPSYHYLIWRSQKSSLLQ